VYRVPADSRTRRSLSSCSLLSDDAHDLLLQKQQPQVKRLLLLKLTKTTEAARMIADIPGVPASWLLPARDIRPARSASVLWELDVTAIREVVQKSVSQQGTSSLFSTPSGLLGGIRWCIDLHCEWGQLGSTIGVFASPISLPAGSLFRCTFSLECVQPAAPCSHESCPSGVGVYLAGNRPTCGSRDFFGLGAMRRGFDEAAWAAKKLPASGSIAASGCL
jgi:hypothetical protein